MAGLAVALIILLMLVKSAGSILRRLLDGVEPTVVDQVEQVILGVDGVLGLDDLKVRWRGHQLHVSASVSVDPNVTVAVGHDLAHVVEHQLHHAFDGPLIVVIHVDAYGDQEAHESTAHHQSRT